MRPLSSGRPLVLTAAALLLLAGLALPAVADPGADDGDGTPSQAEVDQARDRVSGQKRTVAAVQTDLVLANRRLEQAAVAAAQAAEAYNAARWKLTEARAAVRSANARAAKSGRLLARQQKAYGEVLAATYEMSPELSSINAVLGEDGLEGVIETSTTAYQTTTTLDEVRSSYEAAVVVADLATEQAEQARRHAAGLAQQADAARDRAASQEAAAAAEATRVARQKSALIAELADLQDISVQLATRRQAGLEAAAQARAAAAAEAEQAAAAAEAGADQGPRGDGADPQNPQPGNQSGNQSGNPPANPPGNPPPDDPSDDPTTEPKPDPAPQPDPTPPAPSTSGAQRAISFARAQLGEPYKWGAAGPGSWDCSGLTMAAWKSGGKYLPHYSVGQYDTATPIRSSQLQPGDLVFWGSSSRPGSIYHVALYVGGGRIIHAPRTGRPVTEDSMYYWIPPNFFARP